MYIFTGIMHLFSFDFLKLGTQQLERSLAVQNKNLVILSVHDCDEEKSHKEYQRNS